MGSDTIEPNREALLLRIRALGQAVYGSPEEIQEALPELLALFDPDGDPEVLLTVVDALGKAADEVVPESLLPLATADYPDSGVRLAVARALPHGVGSELMRARVAAALVRMTLDVSDDVRDWACFGLAQLDADGEAVRDALVARLDDPHLDTRSEALVALARLGDPRALPAVQQRLTADPDDITMLEIEAAEELADPALSPALKALEELWAEDEDEHTVALRRALRRCDPATAAQAGQVETAMVAAVNSQLASTNISIRLEGAFPRTVVRFICAGKELPREDPLRLWDEEDPATLNLEWEIEQHVGEARRLCTAVAPAIQRQQP